MTKIAVKKVTGQSGAAGLIAADTDAAAALGKLQDGAELIIEYKRNRNARHHRKFFKLIQLIFENQEYYQSADNLREDIEIAIGHTEVVRSKFGDKSGYRRRVKSIDWSTLDQDQFADFYSRAIDFIIGNVMPGMKEGEIKAEVERMLHNG